MANYFDDGGEDGAAPSTAQGGPKGEPEEKNDDDGTSALLPKSILMGKDFKPGDEVVLTIDHIYDDEIEVSYAKDKGKKEETGPKKTTMEESEDDLDKMAVSDTGGY